MGGPFIREEDRDPVAGALLVTTFGLAFAHPCDDGLAAIAEMTSHTYAWRSQSLCSPAIQCGEGEP